MSKFLLIFLFFTVSLFSATKITVYNGTTYCATSIKNKDSLNITIEFRWSDVSSKVSASLLKENITFIETGYVLVGSQCIRDTINFSTYYDLFDEIRASDIDSPDSLYNQKLNNSVNKIKDLFIIEAPKSSFSNSSSISPICTTGKSDTYNSNYYKYYSPLNEELSVKDPSSISNAFSGATFNPDSGKCEYPKEDSPLNLKDFFNKSNSFTSNNTISQNVLNLVELLKTKNDLPNQNSLENKFDIDTRSSSLDCNNSLYNLQEKLLCEMNAGLRKLNQESNPKYSLNNLISILITSADNNAEQTNQSIKSISAFEEVRLQKQKDTNTLLDSTLTNQNQINTTLSQIETTLKGIETNTTGGIVSGGGSTGGTVVPEPTEPQQIDLDKYLKADDSVNTNDLNAINNDTDSIIDSLFSSFTDFKSNFTDSFNSINNQLDGLKETIENPTNIFSKSNIINCPVTYQADFSAFGIGKKSLIVDYCEFTSRLQPIVYFFTYVSLFLGLIFFSFRFIGVLL